MILDPDASFCPCPCPVPSDIFSMGAAAAAAAGGLPRDIFLMGAAAAAAAGADKGTIRLGFYFLEFIRYNINGHQLQINFTKLASFFNSSLKIT